MNNSFKIVKSQIVELVVAANSTLQRFQFTNQPFLVKKKIVSLEIYSDNDMTASPIGNILPTSANLDTAYLTLYGKDPESPSNEGEWLQNIPLWSLHRLNNGTDPFVFELAWFEPREIVWEKSVIVTNAALGNATNLSWVLNVGYSGLESL